MNRMETTISADAPRGRQSEKSEPSMRVAKVQQNSTSSSATNGGKLAPEEFKGLVTLSRVSSAALDMSNTHVERRNSGLTVYAPSVHDVTFGKGGRMHHPGNETFRAECQRLAPQYIQNPKTSVRDDLAVELVSLVYERGGRFLVVDPENKGTWIDAGFEMAIKKAKQLLSDAKKAEAKSTDKDSLSGKKRRSPEPAENNESPQRIRSDHV